MGSAWRSRRRALRNAKLYGPDRVCESGFVDPAKGGNPANVATHLGSHPLSGALRHQGPHGLNLSGRRLR